MQDGQCLEREVEGFVLMRGIYRMEVFACLDVLGRYLNLIFPVSERR